MMAIESLNSPLISWHMLRLFNRPHFLNQRRCPDLRYCLARTLHIHRHARITGGNFIEFSPIKHPGLGAGMSLRLLCSRFVLHDWFVPRGSCVPCPGVLRPGPR
ncbi:hypothetical protein I7I50_09950 [Histoplasma capsulatum G186AR]|uniref:Uncharacterized protein n=1 Tax=Ajellomyces capsulatus TaxID=5037 RepID=A0A8H7Z6W6_AJECA|nr:hypothetical protein I7I52_01188 [Histoplasma capsulatum]QSS68846.1 hypothetical protein I7I50_09950 [Histoplasma capsulatum G186AR]